MKLRSVIFLAALLCLLSAKSSLAMSNTLQYSLQLFSSANSEKAEGIKNTLQTDGYKAWVSMSQHNGNAIYRVHVGKLDSKAAALGLRSKLTSKYSAFPFVSNSFVKTVAR